MDQGPVGGPNQMWKGEVNYNVGSNLFLVGRYAHVKGGFTLDPRGRLDSAMYHDAAGVQRGSQHLHHRPPADAVVMDGNYFKGNHEIKFGFTWRKATTSSTSTYGQDYDQ